MQTPTPNSIGRNALITVGDIDGVPAKVDTGADTSSVWASGIREENGELHFYLFDEGSDYYTGEEIVAYSGCYQQVRVDSSTGHAQKRYVVVLPVIVEGKRLEARFTLADRRAMAYPVLLGRNFLAGQFVVDVSQEIHTDIDLSLHIQKRARRRAA
ncbi:MAG TPA: RimK/LysX family protein [Patescibacteria group bacterium]|nr:RimK/LysX family protein [Patescibacteria group bacterium]